MQIDAIVAPELIRPTNDHVQLFQDFARLSGLNVSIPPEIPKPVLAAIPTLLNVKQEKAVIYALSGTYAEQVWEDLLPEIKREFRGIGEMLRGMKQGNLPHKVVKKTITELIQERKIENDELALAVQRIFEAWQLQYNVVQKQIPLALWPPVFPDRDFEESPHSFTPILRCVRKRFWKLGHEKDISTDSPVVFRGRDWERVLSEVFVTYRDWYRSDQEQWFNRYFTINRLNRHIYDPIWAEPLMTQGELKFGRVQLLIYPPSAVIKINIDGLTFNVDGLMTYPPDLVRAVVEYSGEHPPIPAHPTESYIKMLGSGHGAGRLTQEGSVYRVTLSRRVLKFSAGHSTTIEVRWLDDTHARVSGNQSSLEAQLVVKDKVKLIIKSRLRGSVAWPDLGMSNEETRRLISAWGMWMWEMASVGESYHETHPGLSQVE